MVVQIVGVECLKCYLAGLAAGDGYFDLPDKYGHYRLRIFDKDKDFLKYVQGLVNNSNLPLLTTIYWEGTTWCLMVYGNKDILFELHNLSLNPEHSLDWLKGFVDAEGSIYTWVKKDDKTYYQISITNTNLKYLKIATNTLDKLGIKYRIVLKNEYDRRTNKIYSKTVILINRVKSVKEFLTTVGFRHLGKLSHLPQYQ